MQLILYISQTGVRIHEDGFRPRGKISSHSLPTLNIRADLLLTAAQKGTGPIQICTHTWLLFCGISLWRHYTELMPASFLVEAAVGWQRSAASLKQKFAWSRQAVIWQKPQQYEINTSKYFYHIKIAIARLSQLSALYPTADKFLIWN